jgi:hypothetical protein
MERRLPLAVGSGLATFLLWGGLVHGDESELQKIRPLGE